MEERVLVYGQRRFWWCMRTMIFVSWHFFEKIIGHCITSMKYANLRIKKFYWRLKGLRLISLSLMKCLKKLRLLFSIDFSCKNWFIAWIFDQFGTFSIFGLSFIKGADDQEREFESFWNHFQSIPHVKIGLEDD